MRSCSLLVLAVGLMGCAFGDGRGDDAGPPDAMDAGPSTRTDAGPPTGPDAGPPTGPDAGRPSTDAGPPMGTDAGPSAADAGPMGGALDPRLAPADPSGDRCSSPGSLGECAGVGEVCRYFTSTEGRCETCGACGNLGASCTASADCDILFMCFSGRCTNFCTLGTFECGPVADCLDIGHPTRGVCRP